MPSDPRGAVALAQNPTPAMVAARFKPGQPSANPGGRPKGIERRVRELLKDDWDGIMLAMRDIALGRLPPGITGETTVKIKDRIDAARFCYDRGWGKTRTVVDVLQDMLDEGVGQLEVGELDEATLAMLEDSIRAVTAAGAKRTRILDASSSERPFNPMVDPMPTSPDESARVGMAADDKSTAR